jgi:hypothetical protein
MIETISLTRYLAGSDRQSFRWRSRRSLRRGRLIRASSPLPHERPPAADRAGAFLGARPRDITKVAPCPFAELFVGGQPHHRVGIGEPLYKGRHHVRIRLTASQANRPGPHQWRRVLDFAKVARAVGTPPKRSHHQHQTNPPEPSPHPHVNLPWFTDS